MGRRITIRIDDQCFEKLQSRCQATGLDTSFVVREAPNRYLSEAGIMNAQAKPSSTGLAMPDEAFSLTPPYRAFSGDLRVELRKQFLKLLALAHSTAQIWPRSPGIREVYAGLLALAHYLGIGDGGRHA
jgi:hypothetical protein